MLPRTTLAFRLSRPDVLESLLHEFSLHHGVVASAVESDGAITILVETLDSVSALWDVRATVGMFDEAAVEVPA